MRTTIAAYLLLAATLSVPAFAQGAKDFWKPLAGPPNYSSGDVAMAPDSESIVLRVAGRTYLAKDGKWIPAPRRTILDVPRPPRHYLLSSEYMSGVDSDSLYTYDPSNLYFTTDFGSTWRTVAMGNSLVYPVLHRLPSCVLVPMRGDKFFVTRDNFVTGDTLSTPSGGSSYVLHYAGDTLAEAVGDRVYRSTDLGRSWTSVYQSDTGYYLALNIGNGLWTATGSRLSDGSYMFAYSEDNGTTWTRSTTPDGGSLYINAIGVDHSLYGYTSRNNVAVACRSTDLGLTWDTIAYSYPTVCRDGLLYCYLTQYNGPDVAVYSRDRGTTWDAVSTSGIVSTPFSMTAARDTTWLCTLDSLYLSTDNGEQWHRFSPRSGRGYIMPSDYGAVWFNTFYNATATGLVPICQDYIRPIPLGTGLITSTQKYVWISALPSDGRIYESFDSGCSYWTWTFPVIPDPFLDLLPLRDDTVLFVSKYLIMRNDDMRFIFDTVTPERELDSYSLPTGAAAIDSGGRATVAMADGKLFASNDDAHTWWPLASPSIEGTSYVTHLCAGRQGTLYAIDSNFKTGETRVFQFDSTSGWTDISSGLTRDGFAGSARVTNIWYENGYAYAGTWNMGLFRSVNPVSTVKSVPKPRMAASLDISPNPAKYFVTVVLPQTEGGTLTLADVTGRIEATFPISAGLHSVTLPLERLASGNYVVVFSSNSGVRSVKLSVVR